MYQCLVIQTLFRNKHILLKDNINSALYLEVIVFIKWLDPRDLKQINYTDYSLFYKIKPQFLSTVIFTMLFLTVSYGKLSLVIKLSH